MPQSSWYERNRPTPSGFNPAPIRREQTTPEVNTSSWYDRNREPIPPSEPIKRGKEATWAQSIIAGGLRTIPAVAGGMIGGTTAAATTMGVGTVAGGSIGGAAGAGIGETLAQWYERTQGLREKYNPLQAGVQTAIGAVPFLGKFPGVNATGKEIAKYAGRAALEGGVVNAAATVPTQLAETGTLPSVEQVGGAGLMGAGFGGILGGGSALYPKLRTKGINPQALPQDPNVNVVPPVDTNVVPPGGPPPPYTPKSPKPKTGVPSIKTLQARLGVSAEDAKVIQDKVRTSIKQQKAVAPTIPEATAPPVAPVINQPELPPVQPVSNVTAVRPELPPVTPIQEPVTVRPEAREAFERAKQQVRELPPVEQPTPLSPVAPEEVEPIRKRLRDKIATAKAKNLPPVEQPQTIEVKPGETGVAEIPVKGRKVYTIPEEPRPIGNSDLGKLINETQPVGNPVFDRLLERTKEIVNTPRMSEDLWEELREIGSVLSRHENAPAGFRKAWSNSSSEPKGPKLGPRNIPKKEALPQVDTSIVPQQAVKQLPEVEQPRVEPSNLTKEQIVQKSLDTGTPANVLNSWIRKIAARVENGKRLDIDEVAKMMEATDLDASDINRLHIVSTKAATEAKGIRLVKTPKVDTSVVPEGEVRSLPNVEDITPQKMKVSGVKEGKGGLENIAMGGGSPRTLDVIGSSLYSSSRPVTTVKELLQNAFDEHREHGIKEPVRVLLDTRAKNPTDLNGSPGKSITVRDRGKGLTPDEMYTVLTNVGETGKEGVESASGGFGFAKAAPFLGGKHVSVRSVVDTPKGRMMYSFKGNPIELKNQKKGVAFDAQQVSDKIPTGLEVSTWYDKDMEGFWDAAGWAKNMAERSPSAQSGILLSESYDTSPNQARRWLDEISDDKIPSGITNIPRDNARLHAPQPFPTKQGTIKAPGAEVDIRYDINPKEEHTSADIHLLNKGMYQGKTQVGYGESTPNVPGNIVADIRAIVEEVHDDYPFSVNRERVKDKVTDAINQWVKENIVTGVLQKRVKEVQKMYDDIDVLVSPTQHPIHFLDDGQKFHPDELRTIGHSPELTKGLDVITQIHKDILNVADTLGWKTNLMSDVTWTKVSERLKKFGLLFQEPKKDWRGNLSTTLGIHIPRPDDLNDSSILINLFEHLNLALEKNRPIDELATSLTTTIIHEQAHIPGGGHDVGHSYRDAKLHSILGKTNTIRHFEMIERAFGDGKGNINPAISRLLQIYNTSRKRAASVEDTLIKTGISSKRRIDSSGGKGKDVEGVSRGETKSKPVESKEDFINRTLGITGEQFNKLPKSTRTRVMDVYRGGGEPPSKPPTTKAGGEGEPPKKRGIQPANVVGKVGRIFYKKFVDNNPRFKSIMDRLIRVRSASEPIGKEIRDRFADIKGISKEEIVQFQEDVENGKYPNVREFFDKLHAELEERGAKVGYKENYLPQMWDNTVEEVAAAFGPKTMREKASFQFRSFITDYAEGIEKGLTPKMKPLELMEWYGKRANKLLADREALKSLRQQGYLVSAKNKKTGMKPIESQYGSFEGYYADPSIKAVLENYLRGQDEVGSGIGYHLSKAVSKATNLALSSGVIPGRPLFTAHGANMAFPFMSRSFMEGGLKRNWDALKFGLSPKAADKFLEDEADEIIQFTKEFGHKGQVENAPGSQGGHLFENEGGRLGKAKKGINWLAGQQAKYFENPLFNKMIPALKWKATKANFQKNLRKGMSRKEAGEAAVKVADSFYSGKNLDLMYQNKDFNTFGRIAMAAPDWFRSTVDLGINVPKSMIKILSNPKDPITQAYAKAGGRMMAVYAAANLYQKATTGKFMWENSTADQFNIDMGKDATGDKRRSLKLFNNAGDFFKVPLQVAMSTAKEGGGAEVVESALEGRGSPLTHALIAGVKGEDYKGESNIFSTRDRYGKPVPTSERLKNTLAQTIGFGPPQAAAPYNVATGRMSPEEGLSRIAEAPLKYGKKKKNPFAFEPLNQVPSGRTGKSVWDYGR